MKRWPFLLLALSLVALVGIVAAASELTNPGFDGSLSGWTASGATWSGAVGHTSLGAAYATYNQYVEQYPISLTSGPGVYDVGAWARRSLSGTNGNGAWYLYQYPGSALIRSGSMTPGSTSWTQYHAYAGLDDGYTYLLRLRCTQAGNKVYYDDAILEYGMPFVGVSGNRVTNGGMDGGLLGWSDGTYQAGLGNMDYGYMELDTSPVPTHSVEITVSGDYTVGVAAGFHTGGGLNTLYMYIYDDGGTLKKSVTCGEPASGWNSCSSTYGFAAGDYEVWLDSTAKLLVDDVQIVPQFDIESPPASPTYTAGAFIYYPYVETDLWSTYQVYSNTTWYGDPYEAWTVWRLRPGATVYPVATLDIEEVGINSNGYYVWAWINAWPDIPSTTVRYEGLASVNVSAGQRVGVNCPLGTVGVNRILGEYHLLLYAEFAGSSINPVPFMNVYPTPGYCNLVDPSQADTLGPGAGEVPNRLIEVCQACAVPTTWTNFGRWIAWLWCQIQNLFTCLLANWINQIIGLQVLTLEQAIATSDALQARFNDLVGVNGMVLGRVVDTSAWMVQPVNAGLAWTGGLATDGRAFATAWITNVTDRWRYTGGQLENVIMAVSNIGNDLVVLDLESGGGSGSTVWDVMLALIGLLRDLLLAMLQLVGTLLDFATDLFRLLLMILSGLTGGIESTDRVDLVNFALTGSSHVVVPEEEPEEFGIFEFDPGGGGGGAPNYEFNGGLCGSPTGLVWGTAGPSVVKGVCWFVAGVVLADQIAFQSLIYYLLWAFVGALVIGLLWWFLGGSPAALKGLFR